jgi:RNA polymerase sigma-70 factor, ECF subfamily
MACTRSDDLSGLIRRAQARDGDALAQLLQLHTDRLLESIRGELGERIRQRLESRDVLQQVYLDALNSIDRFVDQGHDSFFAWLRRIAVHRVCDADRRAYQTLKRGAEVRAADLGGGDSLGGLLDALGGTNASPSRAPRSSEGERLLRGALAQLGPDQRQAIELRYLHGLNVVQTATKMDRTERAVRSLCVRALIRLRELLGDAV